MMNQEEIYIRKEYILQERWDVLGKGLELLFKRLLNKNIEIDIREIIDADKHHKIVISAEAEVENNV